MSETSVARRGRGTVRRVAAGVAALILAGGAAACGNAGRPRTVTDTGGAGSQTATQTQPGQTQTAPATTQTAQTAPATQTAPANPPPAGGPHTLTVTPTSASPRATLAFSFTPATAARSEGQIATTYALSVRGPTAAGCVGTHSAGVPVPSAGTPVTVTVGPSQLGGPWCPGSYIARVEEIARPVCGPGTMCPQFIRIVAGFGPARFEITRG